MEKLFKMLIDLDMKKKDFREFVGIKHPWAQDGASFSDRIWTNKEKLVRNLHTELSQCIIRGESPQKAVSRLAKTMGVSQSQAANLILTESAAISSIAQKDCFRELDVDRYQFDATLDGRTCETCGAMDQKAFKMSEFEIGITAPPIHPRCRCCIVPYFDDWDEFGIDTEYRAGNEYQCHGRGGIDCCRAVVGGRYLISRFLELVVRYQRTFRDLRDYNGLFSFASKSLQGWAETKV